MLSKFDQQKILDSVEKDSKVGIPSGAIVENQMISAAVSREIEKEDLWRLEFNEKQAREEGFRLKKIRAQHHRIAHLIALGQTAIEISRVTGVSPGTIPILKTDPTFQQLVSHYVEEEHREFQQEIDSVKEKLKLAGNLSLEHILERLQDEDTAKEMGIGELLRIIERTFDRSGYGPSSTVRTEERITREAILRIKQEANEGNKEVVLSRDEYEASLVENGNESGS